LGGLLQNVPAARLFEEVIKLYTGGKAFESFKQLHHYGLFAMLFPQTEACLVNDNKIFQTMLTRAFFHADERTAQNKSLQPAFMLAILLWPPLKKLTDQYQAEGMKFFPAMFLAIEKVIRHQNKSLRIPKRVANIIKEIWIQQYRLSELQRYGKRSYALLHHPRFRAAYDFLMIRAEAGEPVQEASDWWTKFQTVDDNGRRKMLQELTSRKHK
jgi:poly(A) polymerase